MAIAQNAESAYARPEVFTVVLTGGIASGKSTVSDGFARLGVPVIDTDCIARELVQPGSPALRQIAEDLGQDYLDRRGHLNRRRLRQAIFENRDLRIRLESILHPLIGAEVLCRVAKVRFPYCIVVIPLYAESGRWSWVDRVLVVDVAESVQTERVMERDRISRRDAESILAAQAGRDERLSMADDVIDNSGKPACLARKIEVLHRKYLELAYAEGASR